ncbi:MAG TPA: PEGA domain-containing protein [Methanocorpusculum sp.]|nr:PEGA domain-containing protein [Methanocorpusculum sp.]
MKHFPALILIFGLILLSICASSGAAATGTLAVSVNPANALVYVDGIGVATPVYADLEEGSHTIYVMKTGYSTWQQQVTIHAGETANVSVVLKKKTGADPAATPTEQSGADITGNIVMMPGYEKYPAGTEFGVVKLSSSPSGASVYVDNTYVLTTPFDLKLPVGKHTIIMKHTGQGEWMRDVTVEFAKTVSVHAEMSPETNKGYLSVISEPAGAKVFIDGIYRGLTPETQSVSTGTHQVRLELSGYEAYSASAYVQSLKTAQVSANLEESLIFGEFYVKSIPSGASVYLDGEFLGTTSDEKYVKSGPVAAGYEYMLVVEKDGYETVFESVTASDAVKTITVTLEENKAQSGYISVSSIPAGAGVYIDSKFFGYAPVSQIAVSAGTHVLKVTREGYTDVEETLLVGEGTSIDKTISLSQAQAPAQTADIPYTPVPLAGILAGLAAVVLLRRK